MVPKPFSLTKSLWGALPAKCFLIILLIRGSRWTDTTWSCARLCWFAALYFMHCLRMWRMSFSYPDQDKTSMSFPFGRSENPCCYHKAGSHGCWHWCYGCAHGKSDSSQTWHHWSSEQVCEHIEAIFKTVLIWSNAFVFLNYEYGFKNNVTWCWNKLLKKQARRLLLTFQKPVCSSTQPTANLERSKNNSLKEL